MELVSTKPKPEEEQVLLFLNEKAGKNYRLVDTHLKQIRRILKSGVTADEMRQVIVRQCRKWKGDDTMDQYLRPSTLFRESNFENYLGDLE